MPELPEVDVVRQGLQPFLEGRTIDSAQILHARAVRRQTGGARALTDQVRGQMIRHVSRRGKYLWWVLEDPAGEARSALVMHLGMSGQLLVIDPAAVPERVTRTHLRARFDLGVEHEVWFVDQRTFGGLHLDELVPDDGGGHIPASIVHIARDPLDPLFDEVSFVRSVRRRGSGIKRALLDQTVISGVGNIYADEALWRSRLHYDRPCDRLSSGSLGHLLEHVRAVMSEALAEGGTSFDDLYVNVNGESGYFDRSLQVYGREGEPCARCGRPIVREPFMNRSSFRCPSCQRRPRR